MPKMKATAASLCLILGFALNLWAGDLVHLPSGIIFPQKIEQFNLGPVDEDAAKSKNLDFYYLYPDGQRVIVKVYPAPKDAYGPTQLTNNSSSDASPSFMKEFESIKNRVLKTDDSIAVHAQMRFRAAPQQGGVYGMKVTLAGTTTYTDISLYERNGYFVSYSVAYPSDKWMAYGMTYTDIAHFTKWPKATRGNTVAP
jgi:hypothetical protein